MKNKEGKEVKIGDLIIGRSSLNDLVVGPVIAVNDAKKEVTVGHFQQQAITAVGEVVNATSLVPEAKLVTKKEEPGTKSGFQQ